MAPAHAPGPESSEGVPIRSLIPGSTAAKQHSVKDALAALFNSPAISTLKEVFEHEQQKLPR